MMRNQSLLPRLVVLLLLGAGCAAPASAATILFIGNSFTAGSESRVQGYRPDSVTDLNGTGIGGVPALFKTFTEQAGLHYEVSHELAGGVNLDFHFEQKTELIARSWDHVVLQPYSTLDKDAPGDPTRVIDYAARLTHLLQAENTSVDVRLTATWSRADQTYLASGHWYGKPIEVMAEDVRAACDRALAQAPGMRAVIPVGQAWNLAIAGAIAARNPYLESSQDQINLWATDNYHASSAGYYLEALVVFGSVTGRDPRTLGAQERAAIELGISPPEVTTLQRLAFQTLAREQPTDSGPAPTANQTQASNASAPHVQVGVDTDPCTGVPIQPTAAHKESANVYETWMRDWLNLDWGQKCRYRADNSALTATSRDRVVYIGDSITEGWQTLDPGFFNEQVIDRGISGQTTAQMLVRFRSDVLDLRPALVHIMAGTNDVAGNTGPTSLEDIEGNIATMAELARAHGIDVVLASIPPAATFWWRPAVHPADSIASLNSWLQSYAATNHLAYANYYQAMKDGYGALRPALSDDGVHPNAAGYALMRPIAERATTLALKQRRAARRHAGPTVPQPISQRRPRS
jgi:lysophospholipase L1-like esterase